MRHLAVLLAPLLSLAGACSGGASPTAHSARTDSGVRGQDGGHVVVDAGKPGTGESDAGRDVDALDATIGCSVDGNPGQCMTVASCGDLADHSSTPGYCPGPEDVQCCTLTPNVADNPPVPAGYELMPQADVTAAMTAWAVEILDDPSMYPMFATAMRTFGSLDVLARVEWHPPDFQNSVVHRGVTLYEPI